MRALRIAGAALLLAGCVNIVEHPGLRNRNLLSPCNYQLCEVGQTASGICVEDHDRSLACWSISQAYAPESEGWLRYTTRGCELSLSSHRSSDRYHSCAQLAHRLRRWDRLPAESLSTDPKQTRGDLHIPAVELAPLRELLTRVCDKAEDNGESASSLGATCMAAAVLQNQLAPRAPRKVVLDLLRRACHDVHNMDACYYLNDAFFEGLDMDRLDAQRQERFAERQQRGREEDARREEEQARERQAQEQRSQVYSQMAQSAADALAQAQHSQQSAQDAEQRILAAGADRQRQDAERLTNEATARRLEAQREQERVRQLQERQRERVAEVRSEDVQREEARRRANEERLSRERKAEADRLAREQKLAEERAAKDRKLAEERAERERKQREQEEQAARSRRATEEEERRRREEEKQRREKEQREREAERKRRVGAFIADESFDMSPSGYYAKLGVRVTWSYAAGSSSMCLDSAKQTSYRVSLQLSNQGPQRIRVMIRGTRVYMTGGFPGETSGPSGTRVLDPGAASEISADSGCAEGRPRGVGVSANFAPQDDPR